MKTAPELMAIALLSLSLLWVAPLAADAPAPPKTATCAEDATNGVVCSRKVSKMKPADSFLASNSENGEPVVACTWSCETKRLKRGFVETCKGTKPACKGQRPW